MANNENLNTKNTAAAQTGMTADLSTQTAASHLAEETAANAAVILSDIHSSIVRGSDLTDASSNGDNGNGSGGASFKDAGGNVSSYFTNLPIGQLISAPFIEMAKGQAALCEVYVQTLFNIAFENSKDAKFGESENKTKVLDFTYSKPVVNETDGSVSEQTFRISAPLLALVPLPAFLMDSADVNFSMEVNIANTEETTKEESLNAETKFGFWGFSGNISGKVSSNTKTSSSVTQKATYNISAHASQQPAAEGMAKLTALLAEAMEPINVGGK